MAIAFRCKMAPCIQYILLKCIASIAKKITEKTPKNNQNITKNVDLCLIFRYICRNIYVQSIKMPYIYPETTIFLSLPEPHTRSAKAQMLKLFSNETIDITVLPIYLYIRYALLFN